MQYIYNTREFKIEEPTAVSLGKFDGRHRGHQKLLKRLLSAGAEYGLKTAVFTFSMLPNALVEGKPATQITTNLERKNNLEKMGLDYLVEYPFTEDVAHMLPQEFVGQILAGRMNAKVIAVGTDCTFGYKGAGDVSLLNQLKEQYGYKLIVIQKEQDDHRDISSSYVREELDLGNIEKANELLGDYYAIHGVVVHGNHIGGSVLGFPTVNIIPPAQKHLPRYGVYVSKVYLDGRYYGGITNIGRKPTVEGENLAGVETYIFGIDEDLYGKNIEVQLLHFVRPEQKFGDLNELKEQISRDKAFGMEFLRHLDK